MKRYAWQKEKRGKREESKSQKMIRFEDKEPSINGIQQKRFGNIKRLTRSYGQYGTYALIINQNRSED